MLNRPLGKFTVVMTRKTQPVRSNDKQRIHLGAMTDMAGQTFPLQNRLMDAPHLLVLSLVMTFQAEFLRFLRQHVDIIAGMDRVAVRTVSLPERLMKPGSLVLLFMAVNTD
jgi:hypothetical protein